MFAILGATGKIGRATIAGLRARGARVRAVVRAADGAGDLAAQGCEIAVADVRDAAALERAFAGASAVQVICPTTPRAGDALGEMRSIVDTVATALDRARPAAILAISDYGAELAEGSGVTLAFHHLEAALRRIPASVTLLRSAEHMQNWARVMKIAVVRGVLPSFHHPLSKAFPTVSAPDVGAIAAAILAAPGPAPGVVHVEGPRRYSALEVARTIGELAGREVVARALPEPEWLPTLVGGGMSPSYAELVAGTFAAHNAGRIGVEKGGEVRRGTTELAQAFAPLVGAA